ncbi:MAG TPA: hypothetical protein VHT53_10065 [Candidatus Elarobacter sp.]|nr:hypothetical protein [Candidatus Elarobacter sp.]
MKFARVLSVAAGCVVAAAAVASCSGSFGSGTGLPQTMSSPNFGSNASPTPVPKEASAILTYGESTSFQALPEVGGYSGSVAFPKAAEPTVAPSSKSKKSGTPEPAPTAVSIAIGATLSVVKPQDGPDLNFESGKGKRRKTREHPARALAFITLLPTHDATLASYPRIELEVPREIATQYRDGEFGLALWNAGEKDARYRLAVAELDTASTPPPLHVASVAATPAVATSARPGASGSPSAAPTTVVLGAPRPGTSALPGASPGALPAPVVSATLPPERILFAGTAAPLKLVANRPAIFALYALPHPSSTPVPKASGVTTSSAASAAAKTSPAASPAASAAPSPAPAKSP